MTGKIQIQYVDRDFWLFMATITPIHLCAKIEYFCAICCLPLRKQDNNNNQFTYILLHSQQ